MRTGDAPALRVTGIFHTPLFRDRVTTRRRKHNENAWARHSPVLSYLSVSFLSYLTLSYIAAV